MDKLVIYDNAPVAAADSPDTVYRCFRFPNTAFFKNQLVSTPDGPGVVDGIATENGVATDFVRVNGRLYHWSKVSPR